MAKEFETLDSGKRQDYASGMRRDLQDGKPRFHLIRPEGMPYEEQLLTRWAALMGRGADKYGERNWEKANSEEELARFYESAERHFAQAMAGETDEDHFAAVCFNLNAIVFLQWKLNEPVKGDANASAGVGKDVSGILSSWRPPVPDQ